MVFYFCIIFFESWYFDEGVFVFIILVDVNWCFIIWYEFFVVVDGWVGKGCKGFSMFKDFFDEV